MSSITSDDVNYLIYRYLVESGFDHSAFTFSYEAYLAQAHISPTEIPPGALVTFLQKGLQFLEIEANLNDVGDDMEGCFAHMNSVDLLSKPLKQLRVIAREQRTKEQNAAKKSKIQSTPSSVTDKDSAKKGNQDNGSSGDLASKDASPAGADSEKANVKFASDKEKDKGRVKDGSEGGAATAAAAAAAAATPAATGSTTTGKEPAAAPKPSVLKPAPEEKLKSEDKALKKEASREPDKAPKAAKDARAETKNGSSRSTPREPTAEGQDKAESHPGTKGTGQPAAANNEAKPGAHDAAVKMEVDPPGPEEAKDKPMEPPGPPKALSLQKSGAGAEDKGTGGTADMDVDEAPPADRQKPVQPLIASNESKGPSAQEGAATTAAAGAVSSSLETGAMSEPRIGSLPAHEPSFRKILSDGSEDLESSARVVLTLRGHEKEVFSCAWSPVDNNLASGSGDATARIWRVPNNAITSTGYASSIYSIELLHTPETAEKRDVTTLDWNPSGTLLATGSYDGRARVWSKEGALIAVLEGHVAPIFSLKWNSSGEYLLSGSIDNQAVLWTPEGAKKQVFHHHEKAIMDVDWRNGKQFATCSADTRIYIWELQKAKPLIELKGHQNEVNTIKWDPSGRYLASCSDDFSARLWKPDTSNLSPDQISVQECIQVLKHSKEIYTLRWSPTGHTTENPNLPLQLATASFDCKVKLWDPFKGRELFVLGEHSEPVYTVGFSPNGMLLATGSYDRTVKIWSATTGQNVATFRGEGGVFEVSWDKDGHRVAASSTDSTLSVFDIRQLWTNGGGSSGSTTAQERN